MAMAISTCSDCSFPLINSSIKSYKFTLFSSCKNLPFFILPTSNLSLFHVNSSGYPSPILEDSSTNLPNPMIESDQQFSPNNFDSFLYGLLQDPQTQQLAYEYYSKAKENREFRPEKPTLKLLIRYLIKSKKWGLVISLSEDFKIYNVFPDANTCSTLITSCISARKFKVLNSLLQVLKTDGDIAVLAFDSAMRGYNKLHMYSSTITLYETMKSAEIVPNSSCYCQIMEAYNKIGDTEKVVSLFHEFEGRKLDATPFFTNIYRLVCDSLGKCGRAFEALKIFRDMTRKGISEDSCIYASLICSFASIREVKIAEELFKEAEEKRVLRDPEVFLKVVLMYVEQGSMEKTLDIVVSMKKAKLKVSDCILCAIVNGFCKKRGYWAAIKVYEQLISQGCSPGQVTYASIINAYCRIGLYSKAEMVFSEMQEKGFDKCVVAYSSIVAMYGKTGRIRDAMRLVAKMKAKGCEPNVWIYNSLMDMHGRAKNLRQVEKLWKEMKRRKVAADKVSYTSVISAYNKAREFEKCVNFYNEYRMNGGVIDRAMGGIMVGVFSKLSRIEELVKLLRDMKSEGTRLDERLYHSALNALRDAGLQMQVQWLQQNFEGT
ncbi:pentatricopeptide repeat-containing protein At5g13770, chloroplastic-like [Pistacia vera]|uniref:pentatricopeptide repeat-containing protein At5g13770, chloroplastic-like n=2 Tax=Pistacia vera TaxID=55513 RepID=UPI00126371C5|nr:pentatricopeptide repeat-containing protein At5g13770, chloroplastic-like [Pistacia vera]